MFKWGGENFSQKAFVSEGSFIVGMTVQVVAWQYRFIHEAAHPMLYHRDFGHKNDFS